MENNISELRKILDSLKQIPTDIDVDLLIKLSKIPKAVLKEAKKEIQVPDEIKKEYNDFVKQLKKTIIRRKKEERTRRKNLKKEMENLLKDESTIKEKINKLSKEFNKSNKE